MNGFLVLLAIAVGLGVWYWKRPDQVRVLANKGLSKLQSLKNR